MSSPLRQQRAVRNRRKLTRSNPAQAPSLALAFINLTTHTVDFQALAIAQPPNGTGVPIPLVLNGIPAVERVANHTYPTAAVLQGDGITVRLTYAGDALGSSETFIVGPNDPSVRTAQGSYAGALVFSPPVAPPPPEATVAMTAVSVGGVDVDVTFTPPVDALAVYDPVRFILNGARVPVAFAAIGASSPGTPYTVRMTYSGADVAPGDVIQYAPAPVIPSGLGIATPTTAPVTVT